MWTEQSEEDAGCVWESANPFTWVPGVMDSYEVV